MQFFIRYKINTWIGIPFQNAAIIYNSSIKTDKQNESIKIAAIKFSCICCFL